ncbi:MAG: O-antigen ligase family protein [Patescibacteria group bacterium]
MVNFICLILLLLPTYLIRFSIFNIPTTALEVLIYLVFVYGLFKAKSLGFRKIPLKIILPVGLLILSLVISVIIAPDKRIALGEFKGFFIDPLLVFWLIYQFVKKQDLPKIFWLLILSGTFVAIHTIIQRFLGHVTTDGRVIGLFGYSPNYISLFLAPITVLILTYNFQTTTHNLPKKIWQFVVSCLLAIVCLLAIYFSGSRGGLLAVAAGVGVFFIAYYWSWIRERISSQIIIGILVVMAIYTGWVFFRPDFMASPDSGRVATSNNLRWQIWQTSVELGSYHPILGVGLGNFQNAFGEMTKDRGNFPEYITPMALTPHNIFLMFWLSLGILGLLGFFWLLVLFFRQAFQKINSNKTACVILAVMSSIILYGLIESSIWKNDLSIIFWVMWGLIWVI